MQADCRRTLTQAACNSRRKAPAAALLPGSPAVVPDTGTISMGPAVVDVLVAVVFSGGMSGSCP